MEGQQTQQQAQQQARRISVFREVGLESEERKPVIQRQSRPDLRKLRFRSKPDVFEYSSSPEMADSAIDEQTKNTIDITNPIEVRPHGAISGGSLVYRLSAVAFILAILIPLLQGTPWFGHASIPALGVNGGVIRTERSPVMEYASDSLNRRADSPTDVCVRWSHQSAIVNSTLFIYGGQASTEPDQTENTWNNDFLTVDLTKTWQISTPSMSGLPQPSGPPNVSNGYLWNSHESLYLYGGEFSWTPAVSPSAMATWEYDISSSSWIEHSDPTTSSGNDSAANDQPVQRAAEGAGANVPSLGRGFYFGGHQDGYTTEGWSQAIYRIYLTSLLEFTFPGYKNNQVDALSDNQTAGTDGNYRNITSGGLQDTAGFPERADGLLLYVPGFSPDGILIGLAGGTNTTFQQMNIVDVYDIATSTWYKQATSGSIPNMRVDPCAVVAAAPDGSSYNVYMFGGQNLQPAANQTQYNDMWILTIPSFTWIEVDQAGQIPYGRSGHTCNIWDGQMIVVGGYVGDQLSCDSPGIYVFDLSTLRWGEGFTALSAAMNSTSSGSSSASSAASTATGTETSTVAASKASSSTFVSNSETNPFNQQPAQLTNTTNVGGLEGSYGYEVPEAVVSIIGGGTTGGATVTAPAQTATDGPLATGKPQTYTVTQPDGSTVTETSTPGSTTTGSGSSSSGSSGPNVAAIVAGVIAGLFFLLACYLAFCAWLYRKQLQLYKQHVEMAQRQALNEKPPAIPGLISTRDNSSDRRRPDGTKISSEANSAAGSGGQSVWNTRYERQGSGSANSGAQASLLRRSSEASAEGGDLLSGNEPSFWGTMLAPRRSLRIVNSD